MQEPPFTTPQVKHTLCAGVAQRGEHGAQTEIVQFHRLFEGNLLAGMAFFRRVGVGMVFLHQTSQGLARQTPLMLQVALRDEFALGMRGQPALAVA